MVKFAFVFLFTVVSGGLLAIPAWAENECVACHKALPADAARGYQHFVGSVHDRAQVGCNSCHGGDATATKAAAAHNGVLPAADPNSRVHFQRVPVTCGACHKAQYTGFVRSRHAKRLAGSGKGPNCVTCHGSMATHVLATDQFEQACMACHNGRMGANPDKPWEAVAALTMMRQAATLTDWADEFVGIARKAGQKQKAAEDVQAARQSIAAARTAWHTFDMKLVRQHTADATRSAIAGKERLTK